MRATSAGWIVGAAAILGALAVMAGAFGAHALKPQFSAYQLDIWQTAVLYHMTHALALLALGVYIRTARPSRLLHSAAVLFGVGVTIFSGTLYALALTGITWLGAITPIGGSALILAWLILAISALRDV